MSLLVACLSHVVIFALHHKRTQDLPVDDDPEPVGGTGGGV